MNLYLREITWDRPLPQQRKALERDIAFSIRLAVEQRVMAPMPRDRFDIYAQVIDDLGEND